MPHRPGIHPVPAHSNLGRDGHENPPCMLDGQQTTLGHQTVDVLCRPCMDHHLVALDGEACVQLLIPGDLLHVS